MKGTNILRKIMWFEKTTCPSHLFTDLEPKRKVNENSRYNTGEIYSDKSKRNIQHESGLERKFIEKLERMESVIYYWEQPFKVPYWRGRIKTHTTPDVGIILKSLKVVIVEIKPLSGMLDYKVQMKVEGLLKFCAENGCGFLLTDGTDTLDKIRNVRTNRKLEKEILKALNDTILRKKRCKEIMNCCEATHNELLKIIFKHNLQYKPFPFKLQRENRNKLFHQVFYERKNYDDLMNERISTLFKFKK